jgi:2,3,4,5-tetrahydropyridine-2-carboxylate N-succinyltransferase
MNQQLIQTIETAWEQRELLKQTDTQNAIRSVIEALDKGKLRIAQPTANGNWQVNEWAKKSGYYVFPYCTNGNH